MKDKMVRVILASQSKQRQALMATLGIDFEIIPAYIDEKLIGGDTPQEKVIKTALAKAHKIAEQVVRNDSDKTIIISADTFTVFDDQIYEKPVNLGEAREMLTKLSGQKAVSYTGLAYLDYPSSSDAINPEEFSQTILAPTIVHFRQLIPAEIERYINANPVTTWAGAYSAAYAGGASLIQSIEGSLTGFTHGFPMEEVVPRLQKSGIF